MSTLGGRAPNDEDNPPPPAEKFVSDSALAARSQYREYAPKPLPRRLDFDPSWHVSFAKDKSPEVGPYVLGASGDWVAVQYEDRLLVLSASDGTRLSETSIEGDETRVLANWLIRMRVAAGTTRLFVYELPSLREVSRSTLSETALWLDRGRMLESVESQGVRLLTAVNERPWGSGEYGGDSEREFVAIRDSGAFAWRRRSGLRAVSALAADSERFYVASPREIEALDAATGETLWAVRGTQAAEEGRDDAAAVVADGAVLFADGGRVLRRLDAKTGAPVWECPLGTNQVSSMVAHDGTVYAAVEPTDGSRSQLVAVDARRGKVLWRRAAGGKRLDTVGPEGITLLGAVDAREGIALLDRRSGSIRALFRVGDSPLSLARAVDSTGATWMFASTATREVLGLRLGAVKPLPAKITVRGRVFFGDEAVAGFTLVRDADDPLGRREEVKAKPDGSYETVVRARDVIEIATTEKDVEALKHRLVGDNKSWTCWGSERYVRNGATPDGERFDFRLGCYLTEP